jgi:hypothetical protein
MCRALVASHRRRRRCRFRAVRNRYPCGESICRTRSHRSYYREEGVLRELLGFEPVPRHQAERLEEPCPFAFEEEIELHGPVAAAGCRCGLSCEMEGVVLHVGS